MTKSKHPLFKSESSPPSLSLLLLLVILLNLPLVEHFYKAVFICGKINDCQSLITRDRLSSPQRQRAPPPLRPQITPDTTSDDSSSSSFVFELRNCTCLHHRLPSSLASRHLSNNQFQQLIYDRLNL